MKHEVKALCGSCAGTGAKLVEEWLFDMEVFRHGVYA
jgi:hypothetical protein